MHSVEMIEVLKAVKWLVRTALQRIQTRIFHSLGGTRLKLGSNLALYGMPLVDLSEDSTLEIGSDVVLCSSSRRTALALTHRIKFSTIRRGALISVGARTGISGGTFVAASAIRIGSEVLIGANVTIVDTDFHPVASTGRRDSSDWSRIGVAEVNIGDNVFIGAETIILKGTTIGRDSVVSAGSVVRGQFGDAVIIAGNPAVIVGKVDP